MWGITKLQGFRACAKASGFQVEARLLVQPRVIVTCGAISKPKL